MHTSRFSRMKSAPRFWPLAALILLPVIVLAGVAAWGLEQRRKAQREEAAALCPARSFHNEWGNALNLAITAAPLTVLYDDPPTPRAPAEDDYVLEHWIMGKRIEGMDDKLNYLRKPHTGDEVTAAGLPALVLVRWQELQRLLAEKSPPENLERKVAEFFKLIVVEKPSALSAKMIEQLVPRFPERPPAGAWSGS